MKGLEETRNLIGLDNGIVHKEIDNDKKSDCETDITVRTILNMIEIYQEYFNSSINYIKNKIEDIDKHNTAYMIKPELMQVMNDISKCINISDIDNITHKVRELNN